jgi:hypothetical protein
MTLLLYKNKKSQLLIKVKSIATRIASNNSGYNGVTVFSNLFFSLDPNHYNLGKSKFYVLELFSSSILWTEPWEASFHPGPDFTLEVLYEYLENCRFLFRQKSRDLIIKLVDPD